MSTSILKFPTSSALLTDLYELNMMSSYFDIGMKQTAAFEFYVRRLPKTRNFLIAAGLEQVLRYLENLQFSEEEIAWLANTGRFKQSFLKELATLRFTGKVYAMHEGTVCFADEPILRIVAPLAQAQLFESRVINILHYQTLVASKAARCRAAAHHGYLVDFGMRRAHGAEAALLAARASYIAGFDATSNVAAGREFDIPLSGTMAHSFIQAHDSESTAFVNFARSHPEDLTFLIDTYDTNRGAKRAAEVALQLAVEGINIKSVRIDSGDLCEESKCVRAILDQAGLHDVKIFGSGGLDEHHIAHLTARGAPIDGYGIGTALTVSEDTPALDCVYKLQEYAGIPRRKCSQGKSTWPGCRQVHRVYDDHGLISVDVVSSVDEILEGKPLLSPVMINGRRMASGPSLADIRKHCADEIATLPRALLSLNDWSRSPVKISHQLHELAKELDNKRH